LQAEGGALTVRLSLTVSKCQSLMRAATSCWHESIAVIRAPIIAFEFGAHDCRSGGEQ